MMTDEQYDAVKYELFDLNFAGYKFACQCCDEERAWESIEEDVMLEADDVISWLLPSRGYAHLWVDAPLVRNRTKVAA